jgi:hypothetical protein
MSSTSQLCLAHPLNSHAEPNSLGLGSCHHRGLTRDWGQVLYGFNTSYIANAPLTFLIPPASWSTRIHGFETVRLHQNSGSWQGTSSPPQDMANLLHFHEHNMSIFHNSSRGFWGCEKKIRLFLALSKVHFVER